MDIQTVAKDTANEFKAFILRGNVVDLAVAVVMGAAFGKVVDAFVGSIIHRFMSVVPFINHETPPPIGVLFTAIFTFIAIAAVVFFFVVKPINLLKTMTQKKAEENPAAPAPIPEDIKLLMEIRDLLKAQKSQGQI